MIKDSINCDRTKTFNTFFCYIVSTNFSSNLMEYFEIENPYRKTTDQSFNCCRN